MFTNNLLIAAGLSFALCLALIFLDRRAAMHGDKNLRNSPQTLHKKSISRFGGVAIIGSMFLTSLIAGYNFGNSLLFQVGAYSLLAFIAGFIDDLKINIKPFVRIFLVTPVPVIYFYLFDLKVESLDLWIFDDFLQYEIFAVAFLCFAIVGMINAFNLIDGINGLLGSYLLSILIAFTLVNNDLTPSYEITDEFGKYTTILLGSILGFMVLNFPFGKIFLGDAGAYFLGAIVCYGLIQIHLLNDSSPWLVMCILAYPFTDLCFSVFRKKFILNVSPMEPDAEHLHHLIFKKLKKIKFKKDRSRHFFTVLFISTLNFPYMCASFYFMSSSTILMAIFLAYVASYVLIYFSLRPRFLINNEK